MDKVRWLKSPLVVIPLLVLFAPLGIALMWWGASWKRNTKAIASVASATFFVFALVNGQRKKAAQTRQREVAATTAETRAKPEPRADARDEEKMAKASEPEDFVPAAETKIEISQTKGKVETGGEDGATLTASWDFINFSGHAVSHRLCHVTVFDGVACKDSVPVKHVVRAFFREPPSKGKQMAIPENLWTIWNKQGVVVPGGEAMFWIKVPLRELDKGKCNVERLQATLKCPFVTAVKVEGWPISKPQPLETDTP